MTMKLSERALAALIATDLLEQFDGKTHLLFDDFALFVDRGASNSHATNVTVEFRRKGYVVCTMKRDLMHFDEAHFIRVSGRIPLSVSAA